MFVSLHPPPLLTPSLFLQLQLCEGLDIVASVFTAHVCSYAGGEYGEKCGLVCVTDAVIVSCNPCKLHVSALNSLSAACTLSIHYKLCVFVIVWPAVLSFLTCTQRHIA